MKYLSSQISFFFRGKNTRKNIKILLKFIFLLVSIITAYSIIFHYIMAYEGKEYSWVTGFYWTLTVMSTLGFGDITFASDGGKLFSIIVLVSGVLLLLVLLPFTFIQFFYAPWIEAERQSRTPRALPDHVSGHVIITGFNMVTSALIDRLINQDKKYTLIQGDIQKALDFYDMGYKVSLGNIDDPETYNMMRSHAAAMVVTAGSDEVNTNVAFTVREYNENVPIVCTADSPDSVDILYMAGASLVIQLPDLLGKSLARRTIGGDRKANVIGRFDKLLIAEAPVTGTPLDGKTLAASRLREITQVTVVGVWDRGIFSVPRPDTVLSSTTIMVIAGSEEQLMNYEEMMCIYQASTEPVIIIGAGRVGAAVASALEDRNIDYVIVEKIPEHARGTEKIIAGNAADITVLKKSGIDRSPAAIITTHDDDTNIYLSRYFRGLRPDMQIISRAEADRNVSTLHRAGADFVMSHSALGANTIYNYLENANIVMLAEGLNIFRRKSSPRLRGKTIASSGIRMNTGCTVAAVKTNGIMKINPAPGYVIKDQDEIVLIGTFAAEKLFTEKYGGV